MSLAAAGSLLTASVAGVRPFEHVAPNTLLLFVGKDCRSSLSEFQSLARSERDAALNRIVPVPVDERVSGSVCPMALERIAHTSWRVGLLPADLACRRLREDAAAFHEREFMNLPAFSLGQLAIPLHSHEPVLYELGFVEASEANHAELRALPGNRSTAERREKLMRHSRHAFLHVLGE
jgi:hypothetical protein